MPLTPLKIDLYDARHPIIREAGFIGLDAMPAMLCEGYEQSGLPGEHIFRPPDLLLHLLFT